MDFFEHQTVARRNTGRLIFLFVLAGCSVSSTRASDGGVRRGRATPGSPASGPKSLVLSALAHAGSREPSAAKKAFDQVAVELRLDRAHLKAPDACTPRALEAALDTLAELRAVQKRRILAACAAAVAADRRVVTAEAELFRGVASWLDCPAPLLLPRQSLV